MHRISRAEFLRRSGTGFGSLAAAAMLSEEVRSVAGADRSLDVNPLAAREPHFPGKAKRVIHLFMNGGPSHLDTFDPKPLLKKYQDQALPTNNQRTERRTGSAFPSPFQFERHGESGIEISELFPHLARHADDLCVIRSMHADVPNHEPSFMLMNCGEGRQVRPSMGRG